MTAARSAVSIAQEQLDSGFHRSRWNRATPAERRYLAALADLGDGPQPTADVSARLGQTQQQTAVQRQNLIDVKGLLYSHQRGLIDFTAPLFGDSFGVITRCRTCSRPEPLCQGGSFAQLSVMGLFQKAISWGLQAVAE